MNMPFDVLLEDYLNLALRYYLEKALPNSEVSFVAGDKVENFVADEGSFSIRVLVKKIPYELNFQAEPEILNLLMLEQNLYNYFGFYYPTDSIQDGLILQPDKIPSAVVKYEFVLEVDGESKSIFITLFFKKERADIEWKQYW